MAKSNELQRASEFFSGAAFAAALVAAGVYAPSVIKAQMSFTSNTMITVMMGASATSAIVLDIADRLKVMPKKHRAPSDLGLFQYDGNVIGGALIGVGMATTGACPGTSLVQAGMGSANGLLVVFGGVLGAMAWIKVQPHLEKVRSRVRELLHTEQHTTSTHLDYENQKPLDIAMALGIQPLVLLLIWVPLCISAIQLTFTFDHTVRQIPDVGLVPPAYGGLLIGAAQLATTLFAHHPLGASSAYEDLARWIDSKISRPQTLPSDENNKNTNKPLFTPSLIFSGGVISAAAALSHLLQDSVPSTTVSLASTKSINPSLAAKQIIGGAAMLFGARLAGGCTSGHGISGLAKFSLSSLVTTAAMFAGGIATARIVGY